MPRWIVANTPRTRWITIALLVWIGANAARAAIVFGPPDDAPDAATELKAIDRELAERNFAAAATRIDGLLAARADLLANLSEGTLTSVSAWVDRLPPDRRAALAVEYAKSFGGVAAQTLESLNKTRAARPDELYALARRYPLAPAAGEALAQAGDRSLQLGDLPAAQAFYELAERHGSVLAEPRAAQLDAVRKLNAGAPLPAPADLLEAPRPLIGATPKPPPGRLPFAGPLPADAQWFMLPSASAYAKFFPAAYDGRIFLATWKGVTAFAEGGQVVWNSPHPKPVPSFPVEQHGNAGRGALFAPAVLSDVHGRPVVVVARYPSSQADGQYVLRAINASDGKTLWTTDDTDQRKDLTYCGLPAVSGRYIYSLAAAKTGTSTGTLVLSAVDVSTGAALWQTTLGTVVEQADQRFSGRKNIRNDPLDLDAFASLSEPAVAGDLVYVAPNCGSIIAVGRFDGRIRWVHVYRDGQAGAAANPRDLGIKAGRWLEARDAECAILTRYRSTPVVCGDVLVAMPQDVPAVFAVDRASGRRLWDTDIIEGAGLAGASGNIAVTCGASLCGVDAVTAKLKWKFTPRNGVALAGPAVVVGQTVVAPTTAGLLQLNAADGAERPTYAVPDFRRVLQSDPGRQVVNEARADRSFGGAQRER